MENLNFPMGDRRASSPAQTTDTPRLFLKVSDKEEWERHRNDIREQILISCGLYPLHQDRYSPPYKIFDKRDCGDYTIEKVTIDCLPGYPLCGNLYRPVRNNPISPTLPAVLIAHGHWKDGRFSNGPDGSIPARAITFARQGYIAFSYDMVGYNDTNWFPHRNMDETETAIAGVNLMGLQTWNSLRALDFLESLPSVDTERIAMTGESGGGTQTFILAAIDDRLAASAPCVMVSHIMQGGCVCENAPGLRIKYSNMEIAAAFAPRPQLLVGASGDWTRTTMEVEGPAIANIYKLYHQESNFAYTVFDAPHNINKQSREAVYAFFGKHLMGIDDPVKFQEAPYEMEETEKLRVFPFNSASSPPRTEKSLREAFYQASPPRASSREHYKLLKTLFGFEIPEENLIIHEELELRSGGTLMHIGREGKGDSVPIRLFLTDSATKSAVLLLHPEGMNHFLDEDGCTPGLLAKILIENGITVMMTDLFQTGSAKTLMDIQKNESEINHYNTYNRTVIQERIQDIYTSIQCLRKLYGMKQVGVIGASTAGIWGMAASPQADAMIVDCNGFEPYSNSSMMYEDFPIPGLQRASGIWYIASRYTSDITFHNYPSSAILTAQEQAQQIVTFFSAKPNGNENVKS